MFDNGLIQRKESTLYQSIKNFLLLVIPVNPDMYKSCLSINNNSPTTYNIHLLRKTKQGCPSRGNKRSYQLLQLFLYLQVQLLNERPLLNTSFYKVLLIQNVISFNMRFKTINDFNDFPLTNDTITST